MPVPIQYRTSGEKPTVQFTWIDYLSNVAYGTFYAGASGLNGGEDYFLTVNPNIGSSSYNPNNTYCCYTQAVAGAVTKDFDYEFKVPVVVAADDAFINVFHYTSANNSASVTATIYHVDANGNATQLGTAQHKARGIDSNQYWYDCIKISLPQTKFKAGEKLRLRITYGNNGRFYHDPSGGTSSNTYGGSGTKTSQLILQVPFKIQV